MTIPVGERDLTWAEDTGYTPPVKWVQPASFPICFFHGINNGGVWAYTLAGRQGNEGRMRECARLFSDSFLWQKRAVGLRRASRMLFNLFLFNGL